MKGNYLLFWLIIELCICIFIELYFQGNEGIIGLGIISMIYFAITNIHDMFMVEGIPIQKSKKELIKSA